MADTYRYLEFFYWLSGAAITLSAILLYEIVRIKRDVKSIESKVNSSEAKIHTILSRIDKIKRVTTMNHDDLKNISEKVGSKYDSL